MQDNQKNQGQLDDSIIQDGDKTPQLRSPDDNEEFPSAESVPTRVADRELRVSLADDASPLNAPNQMSQTPVEQTNQPQSKGPKLSHRLSGICPHSTPNIIRVAQVRGLDRQRARNQDNQVESSSINSGRIQQDMAQPNEAQQTNWMNRHIHPQNTWNPQTNASLDESFTGFGSASSTQLIQLYRTGLNMRPNTPTGPSQAAFNMKPDQHRNFAFNNRLNQSNTEYQNGLNNSPLERPQRLDQRLLVSQLRSQQSNYGDSANQAYLSIQEGKIFQSNGMGLSVPQPLAPYGTQSQSTQDLPIILGGVSTNLVREPALAGVKEFLTASNDIQPSISPQTVPQDSRLSGSALRTSEVQEDVEEGSKVEELSLNAPINTIDCRSPPSLGSPIREVNERQSMTIQRLIPVPPGPCASRLQNFTEAHTHGHVSAIHTRQLHTQMQSSLLPSQLPELNHNQQPQPSIVSQASSEVPEIPPNSNTDYARSSQFIQQSAPRFGGSSMGQSQDQDEFGADLAIQSFAISQTNGALTTMAQSSQQDNQSHVTLSGAAGIRPQNLFHRDEMFQIYLQRPPPPSPLRERMRNQPAPQSSELAMRAQRISSPQENSSTEQEPNQSWAPMRTALIQGDLQAFSPADSSILDGDLIDEVDRIAVAAHQEANLGIQSRNSTESHKNAPAQNSSGSSSLQTGRPLNVTREEDEGSQSVPEQIVPIERIQPSGQLQQTQPDGSIQTFQSSAPGMSRVYHEVIENQHRSNQQTLRGLERVAAENEFLRRRVAEMEIESRAMKEQVASMQRVMLEHSRRCPMLGRLSVASGSPSECSGLPLCEPMLSGKNARNQPILKLSSSRPLPQGKSDHGSEESKE